jgi:hypothetical protein
VHPCVILELLVDPLPEGASREGALHPDGVHITDLKSIRELIYKMQRPAIAPNVGSLTIDAKMEGFTTLAHSWFILTTGRQKTSCFSIIVV